MYQSASTKTTTIQACSNVGVGKSRMLMIIISVIAAQSPIVNENGFISIDLLTIRSYVQEERAPAANASAYMELYE